MAESKMNKLSEEDETHHIEAVWTRGSRWRKGEGLVTSLSCIGAWEMGRSVRHNKRQDMMFCGWVWCKRSVVESSCLTQHCFFSPENGIIKGKAEVISEENICPSDEEIYTIVYKVCIKREIIIKCWSQKSAEFVGSYVDWTIDFLWASHRPACVLSPKLVLCLLRHPRVLMNQYFKMTSQGWYMSIHFLAIEKKKKIGTILTI